MCAASRLKVGESVRMRFITGYGRVEKDKETLRVIGLKGGVGDILHIVVGLVSDSKEVEGGWKEKLKRSKVPKHPQGEKDF